MTYILNSMRTHFQGSSSSGVVTLTEFIAYRPESKLYPTKRFIDYEVSKNSIFIVNHFKCKTKEFYLDAFTNKC